MKTVVLIKLDFKKTYNIISFYNAKMISNCFFSHINMALIMEKDCSICFCPIEGEEFSCSDSECDKFLCLDCITLYTTHSIPDKRLPSCTGCKKPFLYNNIYKNKTLLKLYSEACYGMIVGDYGETARKVVEVSEVVNQLRHEKELFLQKKYPAAVNLTIKLCLTSKLRKVESSKLEKIKSIQQKSKRKCIALLCKGTLDENLRCLLCHAKFCMECEEELKPGHKCIADVVESIKEVRKIVKCPKCNISIFRSEGCNHMKCANCGECFDYVTGESGGNGSFNPSLVVKDNYFLHNVYDGYLNKINLRDKMVVLENLEPKQPNPSKINFILVSLLKNNTDISLTESLKIKLSKEYTKYYRFQEKYKEFHKHIREIENIIRKEKLTSKHIDKLINLYNANG